MDVRMCGGVGRYYNQHTLSKLYGNDLNDSSEMDGQMDGGGGESGSEEGMERQKRARRGEE